MSEIFTNSLILAAKLNAANYEKGYKMAQPNAALVLEAYRGLAQAHTQKAQISQQLGKDLQQAVAQGMDSYQKAQDLSEKKRATQAQENLQQQHIDESSRHNKAGEQIAQQNADSNTKVANANAAHTNTQNTILQTQATAANAMVNAMKATHHKDKNGKAVSNIQHHINELNKEGAFITAPFIPPQSTTTSKHYAGLNNGAGNQNIYNLPFVNGSM